MGRWHCHSKPTINEQLCEWKTTRKRRRRQNAWIVAKENYNNDIVVGAQAYTQYGSTTLQSSVCVQCFICPVYLKWTRECVDWMYSPNCGTRLWKAIVLDVYSMTHFAFSIYQQKIVVRASDFIITKLYAHTHTHTLCTMHRIYMKHPNEKLLIASLSLTRSLHSRVIMAIQRHLSSVAQPWIYTIYIVIVFFLLSCVWLSSQCQCASYTKQFSIVSCSYNDFVCVCVYVQFS